MVEGNQCGQDGEDDREGPGRLDRRVIGVASDPSANSCQAEADRCQRNRCGNKMEPPRRPRIEREIAGNNTGEEQCQR